MNDQDVMMREQLSALADGELQGAEFARAMEYAGTEQGRACWHLYHVIGDALRQCEAQAAHTADETLLLRLRAQMAREEGPARLASAGLQQVAPAAQQGGAAAAVDRAANAQVLRWKLAAGFASLAAVSVLGWNAYVGLGRAPGAQGAQLAAAPAAPAAVVPAPAPTVVATGAGTPDASAAQPQVMIRDPRLDELLAAHRQLGNNTSALQMPAGFLRNATFAGRER